MNQRSQMAMDLFSRRWLLLRSVACTAGAAALLSPATNANAAKMTKTAAAYQDSPKGSQQCDNCGLFEPPNACKIVDGEINASAWCKVWVKKAS